jgi:eukaryotic-like serine/threonine-protein kinase
MAGQSIGTPRTKGARAAARASFLRAGDAAQLPPELLEEARDRLAGFAAIVTVLVLIRIALGALWPGVIAYVGPELRAAVLFPFAACSALVAWTAARRAVRPERILAMAFFFQVTFAASLAVMTNFRPWPADVPFPSWSAVAVLTLIAPIIVPTTTPRAIAASILTAAMDPLAFWLYAQITATSLPDAGEMVLRFAPNVIAIPVAVILARIVHRLGERLAHAHDLGSYRLGSRLASGGMGEVWRASHRLLRREAAVKIVRPDMLGEGEEGAPLRERFEREARAIAELRSANTVQLYDYGTAADGTLYYVMELLDGIDLETLVEAHGPLPPERVVTIVRQVCASLEEAHGRGLVHRDVKPANVLLCRYAGVPDHVKVLDFGLVREVKRSGERGKRAETTIVGTPAYLAPEAVTGSRAIGPATDLYCVGCLAYYLLTARLVFDAATPMEMAIAQAAKVPERPSARGGVRVPARLEEIVLLCLEKSPEDRPASARALRTMLDSVPLERPWTEQRATDWWARHSPRVTPHEEAA